MPKVSEQYLADRRAQILDAARRCFLRDGFHATSMQDLFGEARLSSGAVYRYFGGKEEMILAIAEDNMRDVADLIHTIAGEGRESFGAALADVIEVLRAKHETQGLGALAVQVWAEAGRNPALRERFAALLARNRDALVEATRHYQQLGHLPADVDASALAAVFSSLVPGYLLQLALVGPDAVEGVADALRALWPAGGPDR